MSQPAKGKTVSDKKKNWKIAAQRFGCEVTQAETRRMPVGEEAGQ